MALRGPGRRCFALARISIRLGRNLVESSIVVAGACLFSTSALVRPQVLSFGCTWSWSRRCFASACISICLGRNLVELSKERWEGCHAHDAKDLPFLRNEIANSYSCQAIRNASISMRGGRAPLIWWSILPATTARYDNIWHDAYGSP